MRFGSSFELRKVPQWADFYIHYQTLKASIKAGQLSDFQETIDRNITVIKAFIARHQSNFDRSIAGFNELYGLQLDTDRLVDLQDVSHFEVADLYSLLSNIAPSLVQFLDFTSTNRTAVDYISAKLERSMSDNTLPIMIVSGIRQVIDQAYLQCSERIRWVNRLLHTITKHSIQQEYHDTLDNTSSLLLAQLLCRMPNDTAYGAGKALLADQADTLLNCLRGTHPDTSLVESQQLLHELAFITVIHQSNTCFRALLPKFCLSPQVNGRWAEYMHSYIAQTSRSDGAHELIQGAVEEMVTRAICNLEDDAQLSLLVQTDHRGRLLLHYAAEHGLSQVCLEILRLITLHGAKSTETEGAPESSLILAQDASGESPIGIAIRQGHVAMTQAFAVHLGREDANKMAQEYCRLMCLSVRSQYPDVLGLLQDFAPAMFSSNHERDQLLHLLCQYGRADVVETLVSLGARVNAPDETGLTPLMTAVIHGNEDVVQALLAGDCIVSSKDRRGWRAIDHAAYRGLPRVVEMIQNYGQTKDDSHELTPLIPHGMLQPVSPRSTHQQPRHAKTRQSDQTHITANLGSLDLQTKVEPIDIAPYRQSVAPSVVPSASLSLRISSPDCDETYTIRAPVLEDVILKPLRFSSSTRSPTLHFDLFSSVAEYEGPHKNMPIGSGAALLTEISQSPGGRLESLVRSQAVPLIRLDGQSGLVGTITLTIVVCRPFEPSVVPQAPADSLPRKPRTIVGGHRGLSQNDKKHEHLQLRENTLDSFLKALELGATVLEVTKDLIPVVYHDFHVSETGTNGPMYSITHDQLMVFSDRQSPPWEAKSSKPPSASRECSRPRCRSAGPADLDRVVRPWTSQWSKSTPTVSGEYVHCPFISLAELLRGVGEDVCLNIEIKYPMLYEARDFKMDTYALELNLFLDTVLDVTYRHAGKRPIFFTAFSPEVCICLLTKQQLYPVLFGNESNKGPTFDPRATTLQFAIHFAREWGLQGLAIAAEPLVASPGLVDFVRSQGLYCASYGRLNDDVEYAKTQANANLDLIIVNRVRKIALALGEESEG